MSDTGLSRRVEIALDFEGVDISQDVRKNLAGFSYTDSMGEEADDMQVSLDDREGTWLKWLNTPEQPAPAPQPNGWKVGDEVTVTGTPQYTSYGEFTPGIPLTNYTGKITFLNLKKNVPYPIHVDWKGWFAEAQVQLASAIKETMTKAPGGKGAKLHAKLIQKNWNSDGVDVEMDCGTMEMDMPTYSGPPETLTMKSTAASYASGSRTEERSKGWEKIRLSGIVETIATKVGMEWLYMAQEDPYFDRKEQSKEADFAFLKKTCESVGLNLKIRSDMLVVFSRDEWERREPGRTIQKGSTDILKWNFSTGLTSTSYKSCTVTYTNPKTKVTYKGTYTPPNGEKVGAVLEIKEKVSSNAEAERLAKVRYNQKKAAEFTAVITLVGDITLRSGFTVTVKGFGLFDGKYIIEKAVHSVTGGYTVALTLAKVLEENNKAVSSGGWKIGDEVIANGRPQYTSYGEFTPGISLTNHRGKVTLLNLKNGVPYPIHVDQKGWFAESQLTRA